MRRRRIRLLQPHEVPPAALPDPEQPLARAVEAMAGFDALPRDMQRWMTRAPYEYPLDWPARQLALGVPDERVIGAIAEDMRDETIRLQLESVRRIKARKHGQKHGS